MAVYYHFQSNIAYVSHVIGFALGLPLGMAWSSKWKKNLIISIGLLAVYFILFYFVIKYLLPALG